MKKFKVIFQEDNEIKTTIVSNEKLNILKESKNIIKIKELNKELTFSSFKSMKKSEILNMFNQLDMILQANLSLYEAIEIVLKGTKNSLMIELLTSMHNTLKSGNPIYKAFIGFEKYIDHIIISFFKISNMKGNTTLMVSSLCKVLNLKKSNKDLIFSNLSYPIIIFISFIISLFIIFIFVIPKFETIFIQYNLTLPIYTTLLLSVKNFMIDYSFFILILFLVFALYLKIRYKNEKFRYKFDQVIATKIPFVSKLYVQSELYNLFICLSVLCKSDYEFNIALENSTILLKNKYLLDRIQNINKCIKNGLSIYDSFEKANVFDDIVLNLINSGEKSSTMNEALQRIEQYYKVNFTKSIKGFSSLIEPVFFAVMMLLILWVMLAIFTPIWNMSEMINL